MRFLILLLIVFSFADLLAQAPQVPHKLKFADLTLTIRDDARREIQKDVDALTQSPRHFNIKVERAKTYFPIIDKIFEEENLPVDFKYLVIQESALIPDAVSVSKAVGFWQFKDFTAIEMGLRVDREVDERLNIVSSTRAAARYIKRNNTHFNNWLFALQAYQMGAGGVMRSEKDFKEGHTNIEITSKTYWYVKKFLAHKIAFENAVSTPGQLVRVVAQDSKSKQTLKDVAQEVSVDIEEIRNYNKWLKTERIPGDKTYAVIIPLIIGTTIAEDTPPYVASGKTNVPSGDVRAGENRVKPIANERKEINGIDAIKARPGETASALAKRAGISLNYFLKYNEMTQREKVRAGEYYFTAKKRARAMADYHKVEAGEDIWLISQRYGVKMSKLRRFNRLDENEPVREGTLLYLSSVKPKNASNPVITDDVVEVSKQEEFSWGSESEIAESVSEAPSVDKKPDSTTTILVESTAKPIAVNDSIADVSTVITDSVSQTPPNESPLEEHLIQHTVKKGETLYGIAKAYNMGVMEIVELNNLNINDGIKPGELLKVRPSPHTTTVRTEPIEVIHVVQKSDTLYSVARKYDVTIQQLMDWNGKSDSALNVGEKLRVLKSDAK